MQKLEIFGTEYLFQLADIHARDELYRMYIASGLRLIAKIGGRLGNADINMPSYHELLQKTPETETRSPDEIKAGILAEYEKIGGEGK